MKFANKMLKPVIWKHTGNMKKKLISWTSSFGPTQCNQECLLIKGKLIPGERCEDQENH